MGLRVEARPKRVMNGPLVEIRSASKPRQRPESALGLRSRQRLHGGNNAWSDKEGIVDRKSP